MKLNIPSIKPEHKIWPFVQRYQNHYILLISSKLSSNWNLTFTVIVTVQSNMLDKPYLFLWSQCGNDYNGDPPPPPAKKKGGGAGRESTRAKFDRTHETFWWERLKGHYVKDHLYSGGTTLSTKTPSRRQSKNNLTHGRGGGLHSLISPVFFCPYQYLYTVTSLF